MINYITLGSNDVAADAPFFDTLVAHLGGKRLMELPHGIIWGTQFGAPSIGLLKPFNKETASVGNGTMVALNAKSREEVDSTWKLALANGGADEGAPGERMPGFYAAYFRSPTGHKFAITKMG